MVLDIEICGSGISSVVLYMLLDIVICKSGISSVVLLQRLLFHLYDFKQYELVSNLLVEIAAAWN